MTPLERLIADNYPLGKVSARLDNLTPLMFAAKNGLADYMNKKLNAVEEEEKKQLLGATNVGGLTSLHFAARYGQVEALKVLLTHGASPLLKTKLGLLPIHLAFHQDNNSQKVLELFESLSPYQEALSAPDGFGETVAHLAAQRGLVDVLIGVKAYNPKVLNKKNNQSMTPLLVAVLNNQLETTRYLLKEPDSTITDSKGRNALHYGAIYSTKELLAELIPYFSNSIDRVSIDKKTALQYALESKQRDLGKVTLLLKAGAYIDKQLAHELNLDESLLSRTDSLNMKQTM